jgi:hypothetical protein
MQVSTSTPTLIVELPLQCNDNILKQKLCMSVNRKIARILKHVKHKMSLQERKKKHKIVVIVLHIIDDYYYVGI